MNNRWKVIFTADLMPPHAS